MSQAGNLNLEALPAKADNAEVVKEEDEESLSTEQIEQRLNRFLHQLPSSTSSIFSSSSYSSSASISTSTLTSVHTATASTGISHTVTNKQLENNVDNVHGFVDDIIHRINQRKDALHVDSEITPVGNKILSPDFKNINGVSKHLEHRRKIQTSQLSEVVQDPWSHGYISKAELLQQYTKKDKTVRKGKTIF